MGPSASTTGNKPSLPGGRHESNTQLTLSIGR